MFACIKYKNMCMNQHGELCFKDRQMLFGRTPDVNSANGLFQLKPIKNGEPFD